MVWKIEQVNNVEVQALTKLFSEAYERCFGYAVNAALTEQESKRFSGSVYESTGLVIGWKELKNYSRHITSASIDIEKRLPVATMDALARYVMRAPRTSEDERKNEKGDFPYWREYKNHLLRGAKRGVATKLSKKKFISGSRLIIIGILLLGVAVVLMFQQHLF